MGQWATGSKCVLNQILGSMRLPWEALNGNGDTVGDDHKLLLTIQLTKTRWRNLRERFVREKKRLVTLGEEAYSAKDPWPLLEDMTFLWDFIVHRERPSKTFKAEQVIMQSFLPILPRPEWVDVASDQGASSDNIEPSCTLKRGEETKLPIKRERDLVEEEATESKLRRLLDHPSSHVSRTLYQK
uniref:MADF domain-containing protein n=1 Tax=Timema bartmani TaxID=61472 RepID=A0A7R9I7Z4_9NEOP|nr:unnamed protein product [Timema bartmani]